MGDKKKVDVEVWTSDGKSKVVPTKPEDVRAMEDLPFTSSNVTRTRVVEDRR